MLIWRLQTRERRYEARRMFQMSRCAASWTDAEAARRTAIARDYE